VSLGTVVLVSLPGSSLVKIREALAGLSAAAGAVVVDLIAAADAAEALARAWKRDLRTAAARATPLRLPELPVHTIRLDIGGYARLVHPDDTVKRVVEGPLTDPAAAFSRTPTSVRDGRPLRVRAYRPDPRGSAPSQEATMKLAAVRRWRVARRRLDEVAAGGWDSSPRNRIAKARWDAA